MKCREISRGVRNDKINPYIEDAEFLDIRPLLGDKLFYDISKDPQSPKYVELLNGGMYQHVNESYKNPGLKKVLSIYAYSRYILFGSFTDTAFGFVEKSNQDSKPVGDGQKRNLYTKNRNIAYNYWLEVAKFLNRNKSDYPLWGNNIACEKGAKSNLRISKIS